MPKPLKDSRYGVYKGTITNGFVSRGNYVCGDYIGVFTWDQLIANIVPDLRQYRLETSDYPVLITSWRLKAGDPPKSLPENVPSQKLNVKAAGGLRDLKEMIGMPLKRKKVASSEIREAVVDSTERAVKVVGQRLLEQK
jgi:hypothetical protein